MWCKNEPTRPNHIGSSDPQLEGHRYSGKAQGELQDYMAHQVAIYMGKPPTDPFKLMDWDAQYMLLTDFCKKAMGMDE